MPGFDGRYFVSDDGRVVSLVSAPRVLTPVRTNRGYAGLTLGRGNHVLIHRVVLESFVGTPTPGQEARHLNGVRLDNRLANLAWGTRAENFADRRLHGTDNAGERNPLAKLTDVQVRALRDERESGASLAVLAARYNVSKSRVSEIVNHRTYRAWVA